MTDKDKAILEAFEKWFAEQSVHNPDLYKWGALWICWQDAWQARRLRELSNKEGEE